MAMPLFHTAAGQAHLINAAGGKVLFSKNANRALQPGSLVKLLTLAVLFRELHAGRRKMSDRFRVSENAWRKGGAASGTSSMFLRLNSEVAIAQLIEGVAVQSANDAAIVLAEGVSGSEESFSRIMTHYARGIGLNASQFANATGLPMKGNRTTARDLAVLAWHMIFAYPKYYSYFAQKEFRYGRHRFFNRNPLLATVKADGLKTGYSKDPGYLIVASKSIQKKRCIAVLAGLKSKQARSREGRRLLEYGFEVLR